MEDFKVSKVEEIEVVSAIGDSYYFYYKKVEQPIERKLYNKIACGFNLFIVDKVIEGNEVRLPSKLGILTIVGTKHEVTINKEGEVRGLAVDWGNTKKLWEKDEIARQKRTKIYHFNEHTGGIGYRLVWDNKNVIFTNRTFYSLIHTRGPLGVSRKIAKKIKTEDKEYQVKINR